MRLVEFAGTRAELAPGLEQFAGFVELEDFVVARAVAFGNEYIAVLRDDHVIGRKEGSGSAAPPLGPSVMNSLPSLLNSNT